MTPSHFLSVFTVPTGRQGGDGTDRVEALRQANDERARRGLRPLIPSWV